MTAHFFENLLQAGGDSGASSLEFGASAILGILAVPGALFSLMLFDKYSSLLRFVRGTPRFDHYLASIPDKYFFIVFSMTITGIIAVLKWDKILPGRQDYANLAPLPLPMRNIFLANVLAILTAAAIFALDVNAASSLLFPAIVTAEGGSVTATLRFMLTHAAVVVLASLFTFFGALALMGGLMSLLPQSVFRRISLPVRVGFTIALVALFSTCFAAPSLIRTLSLDPESWARYIPSLWFLGLYQSIQGKQIAVLANLGAFAWQGALAVFVLSLITTALSYRRYFLRIPESADRRQSEARAGRQWFLKASRLWLKNPVESSCYHFTLRSLFRSEEHCLLLGAVLAMGCVAASQIASSAMSRTFPNAAMLAVPLIVSYCLITGLRLVFDIPSAVRSNWVFQLTVDQENHSAPAVARKVVLTFLIPGIIVPTLAICLVTAGPGIAFAHSAYVLAMSLALTEALLGRYRKIPFTCTMPTFQNHVVAVLFMHFTGFFFFSFTGASLELWMWRDPWRFALLPVAWFLLRWLVMDLRRDMSDTEERLLYEDRPPADVVGLNLMGRS